MTNKAGNGKHDNVVETTGHQKAADDEGGENQHQKTFYLDSEVHALALDIHPPVDSWDAQKLIQLTYLSLSAVLFVSLSLFATLISLCLLFVPVITVAEA